MNTSRSTVDMTQHSNDMSAFTYIMNTVNSIRLQAVGQKDNDLGATILASICAMIQTYKPVKPIAPRGHEVADTQGVLI